MGVLVGFLGFLRWKGDAHVLYHSDVLETSNSHKTYIDYSRTHHPIFNVIPPPLVP